MDGKIKGSTRGPRGPKNQEKDLIKTLNDEIPKNLAISNSICIQIQFKVRRVFLSITVNLEEKQEKFWIFFSKGDIFQETFSIKTEKGCWNCDEPRGQ